jgi:hypothetical protein
MDHEENASASDQGFLNRLRSAWNRLAIKLRNKGKSDYQTLLACQYSYFIPKGSKVLELGVRDDELMAALGPSYGILVNPNLESICHCNCEGFEGEVRFLKTDHNDLELGESKFDYVIFPDTFSYLDDILKTLKLIKPYCHARTRIIVNFYSRLWQPLLYLLTILGLKRPQRIANWVTREDVRNLMGLAGFEPILIDQRILLPIHVPVISMILNKFLAPFPPFRWLCLTNWVVGRLPVTVNPTDGVSVVCPCRNEAGNIFNICKRMPALGCESELIFVEGNSSDDTLDKCKEAKVAFPHIDISVFQQTGKGKGDAVRLGFEKSKHEILVILDADMTVKPEDLPLFVEALKSGVCEFVNGSRLVYAMEDKAMRFLNLLGNKFFSLAFTFLLGQPIKDTLCGTKVLLKSDYQRLANQRDFFGDFDPFGDFDLLFGASKLALKIMDLPVHYQARTYGTTQISRFSHGLLLFRMCGVGLVRLKMR